MTYVFRSIPEDTHAPLVPILRRFSSIVPSEFDESQSIENEDDSPVDCFLRFANLPENDMVPIDLRQAAVLIMAHLDRLSSPHIPTTTFIKINVSYTIRSYTLIVCS